MLSLVSLNSGGQQSVTAPVPKNDLAAAGLTYEVASIRKFKPDGDSMMITIKTNDDGLTATHFSLKNLVCFAYDKRDYQVSGGPSWIDSDYYDVVAKMNDATMETIKKLPTKEANAMRGRMLQALLADRFKLAVHRETKQLPTFALVVAKGGTRLHTVAADQQPKGMMNMDWRSGGIVMTAQGTSMDAFAGQIGEELHYTVVNKTGLAGAYDFTLHYSHDSSEADEASGSGSEPSIYAAVQEQLGLKLEKSKAPVEVLVIDHAEPPSAN